MRPVEVAPTKNRLSKENLRQLLKAACKEKPPPSLLQVARRVGYKSEAGVYKRFPRLAKRITSRHRNHRTNTRHSSRTVKAALESALVSEEIDSLKEVARSLGYSNTAVLSARFPVLYAAVIKKCQLRRKAKVTKVMRSARSALLSARNENPPPALNVLARRLGYKSSGLFRDHFPGLSKAISARFLEWRRSRKESKRISLEAALRENPAPSMKEIAKRIGVSANVLSQPFPELAGQISKRHKKQKTRALASAKERAKESDTTCNLRAKQKWRLSNPQ